MTPTSYETVFKRPFWRGSCAGSTKLSRRPDHDPRYTKWTEVARNLIETTILGFLCQGVTKLSLGPDHDPKYTKWMEVAGNWIETAILAFWRVSCAGAAKLSLQPDHVPKCAKWTHVVRNCIETSILEGFLCRGHKTKPGARS